MVSTETYSLLILAASACGIAMGIAMIVDAWGNMLFVPSLIFSLLAPIGGGFTLGTLGMASRSGSRRSFSASWVLGGILAVPAGFAVFLLVVFRQPGGILKEWPQIGDAERIALASLVVCFALLVAIAIVGFRMRGRIRTGS